MICPLCGGRTVVANNPRAIRDHGLHHEETIAMEGCLCFYSLEELGAMLEQFEDSLSVFLQKHFANCSSMDAVRSAVRSLPKHSPLRSETSRRLRVLDRVRERVGSGRKMRVKANEEKERVVGVKEDAIRGESLSFNDWMKTFG